MTSFLDDMKKRAIATAAQRRDSEEHRIRRTLDTISAQCSILAGNLEAEIEKNAAGKTWEPIGRITHYLKQTAGNRIFRISLCSYHEGFKLADVRNTPGFLELTAKCESLGVNLELTEETFASNVYPVIRISGWEL